MNREFEKNLIACLDSLEQGDSIDAVLAGHPQGAAGLRPSLEMAVQLPQLASRPAVAAQRQSQAAFLAAAAALRSPQSASIPFWFPLRRLLMPLASLAVILLLLGFTLVAMSTAALPGDGLYPVKLGLEEFRLQRAADTEHGLMLAEEFQQERLREIEVLLRSNRLAEVLFEGEIESITPAAWIIAGLPVQIDNATEVEGTPRLGELARVTGRTADGQLFAHQIILLTGTADPDEIPLPAILPTIEATPTPQPNATPAATPAPSAAGEFQPVPLPPPGDGAEFPPSATADTIDNDSDSDSDGEGEGDGDDNSSDDGGGSGGDNDNGDDEENSNEYDDSGDDEENSNEEEGDGGDDEENSNEDEGDGGDDEENSNEDEGDGGDDEENSNEDEDDGGDDEENSNEEEDDGGDDEENSNEDEGDGGDDNEADAVNDNDDDSRDSGDDGDNDNEEDGGDGDN